MRLGKDHPAQLHFRLHWTHCTHLTRADFDVEVAPLVGNFKDLGPGKTVDPQPVPVDEEAIGTDAQHDVDTL